MTAGKFNDLRHFCFGNFVGEHAANPHTVAMDMQHYLNRVLPALGEKIFQDMNDEFHRRVVVVQQQNLVKRRLFDLGAGFRDDTGAGTILALAVIVVAGVLHSTDFCAALPV